MNKVTLDHSHRLTLDCPNSQVQVCDQQGRTVGYYLPAKIHDELLYAWAKSQVGEQELELARRQQGGRSLSEILELNEQSQIRDRQERTGMEAGITRA
jgi:hypothetical protein